MFPSISITPSLRCTQTNDPRLPNWSNNSHVFTTIYLCQQCTYSDRHWHFPNVLWPNKGWARPTWSALNSHRLPFGGHGSCLCALFPLYWRQQCVLLRCDPSRGRCLEGPFLKVTRESVRNRNCPLGDSGEQRGSYRERREHPKAKSGGKKETLRWRDLLLSGDQTLPDDGQPAEQAGRAQQQPLALHPDWQRHLRQVRLRGQTASPAREAHLAAEDQHP